MTLKVLGSSSAGNCYILENEHEALIIEAGLPFMDVKKALKFNIRKINGVLISHEHRDHARYVKDYVKAGIPVYTNQSTYDALKMRTKVIEPLKQIKVGNYAITPFNVPHEDVECYGYIIEHSEMGKMLFLTDLEYCKYNFASLHLNHILVEANYDMQYVDRDIPNYEHKLRGHMSLDTALDLIRTNDNPDLRTVCLLHLSIESGNPAEFQKRIVDATSKYRANCYIASRNLEIQLDLLPFG